MSVIVPGNTKKIGRPCIT